MESGILVILISAIAFAMIANRLSSTILTAPMFFLAMGFALSFTGFIEPAKAESVLHVVAEISLIILLFLDASQISLHKLKTQNVLPLRMLLIGLPLCVLIGTLVAIPFFPDWPLVAIALVAAILSPTDAALGQAVVSNENVPNSERQSLTVESGLNDGLALPVILFFASLVALTAGHSDDIASNKDFDWIMFGVKQIIFAPLIGIAVGWMGAKIFLYCEQHELTSPTYEGIGVLALAGVTYLLASAVGGNGFIACFVAGSAFGNLVKGHCRFLYEFTESEGQMLVWASFLFVGLGLLPEAIEKLTWPIASYLLISLFLVRPVAIYISLLGTKTKLVTRLFFGWYGPRGLATALFALLVAKEIGHEFSHDIIVIAINAVWMSALLHGVTAAPGANWYAKKMKSNKSKGGRS